MQERCTGSTIVDGLVPPKVSGAVCGAPPPRTCTERTVATSSPSIVTDTVTFTERSIERPGSSATCGITVIESMGTLTGDDVQVAGASPGNGIAQGNATVNGLLPAVSVPSGVKCVPPVASR